MSLLEEEDSTARVVTGRIKVHPDGYAFVVPDDHTEDIHVNARARGPAMDADKVEVEWWVGARGLEGKVRRVIERGRGKITGQIGGSGKNVYLTPDDPRISGQVVLRGGAHGAKVGQAVVAEIARYPLHPADHMEVTVLKVLGDPDDPRTEVEKILACADVSEEFPADVMRAASHVPEEVRPNDRKDRVDLRHIPFMTIDPETARDFDDAVAVEPLTDGGHRLWVAVADVSHYVREGSPIDKEARRRGFSVYLPSRAIPMLPEALSSHLCSLVPEVDRLAMVVRIDLDRDGATRDSDFAAAVIHSRARLDYPGVAAALGGDTKGKRKKYEPHVDTLRVMDTLAQKLRQRRFARGALDLDLPEAVVELDRDDPRLVREVRRSRRDPGERGAYAMIEEFMLAANEAVGDSFQKRGEEVLWRIHEAPDAMKLENFVNLAQSYGLAVNVDELRTPRGLGKLLVKLKGHSAQKPLSFQLLRSLKQASYDLVNVGHFGLASPAYVQFTSPIRRYPDVVAHRRLKQRLALIGRPSGGFGAKPADKAAEKTVESESAVMVAIAAEASFSERKAMEIEREVMDLYRAFFMRDKVGDVFDGTISAVTSFGIFVVIDEPYIEGLVRMEELGDDIFSFEETHLRLVGRRTGRTFALGDSVKVEILSVSVARRRIDFRLHAHRAEIHFKGTLGGRDDRGRGRRGRGPERGPDRGQDRQRIEARSEGRSEPRTDLGGVGRKAPINGAGSSPATRRPARPPVGKESGKEGGKESGKESGKDGTRPPVREAARPPAIPEAPRRGISRKEIRIPVRGSLPDKDRSRRGRAGTPKSPRGGRPGRRRDG
jgi:ribonuclease R